MFLLDTCVVWEGPKPDLNEHVRSWMAAQPSGNLFISALTAGELRYGVAALPDGRKSRSLKMWLEETLQTGFAGRILPFGEEVANIWGELRARNPNAEIVDSQIAATALWRNLTLVTRNVRDFAFDGLRVFNPWRN